MIKEYQAFLEAFKAGKSIKNAAQVKNYTIFGNNIGLLLIALATISQGLGFHIPISDDDMLSVGKGLGSLYLLVNAVTHVVTSEKVGIK
jgi:hypothetical protein